MSRLAHRIGSLIAVLGVVALAGCQGQKSEEPPIVPIRNMHQVPRYDPQARSKYFQDHRTMRPPVAHTVAREEVVDPVIATGVEADGTYAMTIPQPVVEQAGGMEPLLARGEDRFDIYCVPCHGGVGEGDGMVPEVSQVSTIRPPSYHDDRIRHMPDGQIFATIRNGIRNMPAYRATIPVADRWAIVAYVRALQLSQMDQRTAMRTETDR